MLLASSRGETRGLRKLAWDDMDCAGGMARDRVVLVPVSFLASALPASSRKEGGGLLGVPLHLLDRAGGVVCDIVIPVPGSAPHRDRGMYRVAGKCVRRFVL